jgi:L-lactate permease
MEVFMNLLAIIGLLAFVLIVVLLIKGPFSPLVVFILVPFIAALLAGYSPKEIGEFAVKGFASVQTAIIVTAFAILYFSIMTDVGMFEIKLTVFDHSTRVARLLKQPPARCAGTRRVLSSPGIATAAPIQSPSHRRSALRWMAIIPS